MIDGNNQPDTLVLNKPTRLFKPGSWLAKIDFINHLILFNNVLITVLSEKEGGKTSFGQLLRSNLDQQIKSVTTTVEAPYNRAQMISLIATELHLNYDMETNLHSLVAQINERKAHVLLSIDNAQNLSEAFIKELLVAIKNQGDFGFFHACLISDYSVIASLNQLTAEHFSNLVHTIEIGPLNESETKTYTNQRALSSPLFDKPLSDVSLKKFYELTKGNLAKINSSLDEFMVKSSKIKPRKKFVMLKNASMAISAALVAGMSYVYFNDVYLTGPAPQSLATNTISIPAVVEHAATELSSEALAQLESHIAPWQELATVQYMHYGLPKQQFLDDGDDDHLTTVALVDKVVVIPTFKSRELTAAAELAASKHLTKPVIETSTLVPVAIAKRQEKMPKAKVATAKIKPK
ncbi:MAG: ATP-binding protein, partial [Legionella sp.]